MSKLPDIDIDFADHRKAIEAIGAVPAMTLKDGRRSIHPSGAYLQDIPVDPFTGLAVYDYNEAEHRGFNKIDFLNQSVYKQVRDEEHLLKLIEDDPPWEILDEEAFVEQLSHIGQHFHIVRSIQPKSVSDLALVLALIRPSKKHLLGKPRDVIEREIWKLDGDGYAFKKAHATSYAMMIAVQMNLLAEQLLGEDECIQW